MLASKMRAVGNSAMRDCLATQPTDQTTPKWAPKIVGERYISFWSKEANESIRT
jgi:hypothetical protein